MPTASTIAEFIKANNSKYTKNTIQRILYFIQGISLAETGKPFFDEVFTATHEGPRIENILQEEEPDDIFVVLDKGAEIKTPEYDLSDSEVREIKRIVAFVNQIPVFDQINLTLASPWKIKYFFRSDDKTISNDRIREWFKKNLDNIQIAFSAKLEKRGKM